ncbi:MAG: nucleotidyltransferase family protein [Methanobacteriaceae archaeon]|nr:nucleotidyltransferase family protein [Methanobacteriaceae archaeon]
MFKDNDFQLRHEDELMLSCARTQVNEEIEKKIISLASMDLDWEYLINMVSRHRLRPLLYVNLNSICPKKVPEDVLESLKSYYMANVQKNLMLTGELVKIIEILESNDIKAIPYKGPVLASLAYGNIGLRQFGDIDILIDETDALKVKEIMISEGYELYSNIIIDNAVYMKLVTEHQFISRNGVIIEIKWRFAGDFFSLATDSSFLSENLNKLDLNCFQICNFSSVNQLIVLCIHAGKHYWTRLSWICDISEFIKSQNIDWEEALEKAEKLGTKRILLVSLFLAEDLFGLILPDKIIQQYIIDSQIEKISLQIKKMIFLEKKAELSLFEKFFLDLKKRENLIYSIKDCYSELTKPTQRDYNDIALPLFFFRIYVFIRPFLLIKRYRKDSI